MHSPAREGLNPPNLLEGPWYLTCTLRLSNLLFSSGNWMIWAFRSPIQPPLISQHQPNNEHMTQMNPGIWIQNIMTHSWKMAEAVSFCGQPPKCMYSSRNFFWSWDPWSCPSLVLSEPVFSFNSVFSCITPISSLLHELARICFCCLQAKDFNWDKWQHKNDTECCARFFWVGLVCAGVGCVMTQGSHSFLYLFCCEASYLTVDNMLRHHLFFTRCKNITYVLSSHLFLWVCVSSSGT